MELAAIQVPTIVEPPDRESGSEDGPWIVSYADWLMNLVLRTAPSGLRAEMRDSDDRNVRWERLKKPGACEETEPLSHTTPTDIFRSILARFGHHYLDGQLYGGSCERILVWRDQQFAAQFDCSNSGSSGFWIEIHAEPLVESQTNTNTST